MEERSDRVETSWDILTSWMQEVRGRKDYNLILMFLPWVIGKAIFVLNVLNLNSEDKYVQNI